jgi:hypothetical protein
VGAGVRGNFLGREWQAVRRQFGRLAVAPLLDELGQLLVPRRLRLRAVWHMAIVDQVITPTHRLCAPALMVRDGPFDPPPA